MRDLRQEILQKKREPNEGDYLVQLHHVLMKCYNSWIPFEEFKKLPIPTVVDLISESNEDAERKLKEYEKSKRKSK